MRLLPVAAVAAVASLLIRPVAAQAPARSTTLVVQHATVVDVRSGRLLPDRTVRIDGNRITAIAPSAETELPGSAQVIDGRGKYLIPGLVETHAHLFQPWQRNWPDTLAQLGWLVAGGVTTVRDAAAGGLEPNYLALRRARDAGQIVAPRLVISGFASRVRAQTKAATSAEALRRFPELGLDQVKIRSLSREAALALIREARHTGLPVYGHSAWFIDDTTRESYAMAAVQAGISGLSHYDGSQKDGVIVLPGLAGITYQSSQAELVRSDVETLALQLSTDTSWQRALIDTMVARGTWLEPTLVVGFYDRAALYGYCGEEYDVREVWRYYPFHPAPTKIEHSPARADTVRRICAARNDFVRRFYEAGGMVVAGSDYVPFAPLGVPAEMRLLVRAGLPPNAALQAATINAARALGLAADIGTIEPGKLADLVLLDANPLEDIAHVQRIAAVVADGRLVDRLGLLARAATTPPMVSYDDRLERLGERVRALAFQHPDSVIDLVIRTDGTMRPEDQRGFEVQGLEIHRVEGPTIFARGRAVSTRFASRVRFVERIELATPRASSR